MSRKEVLRLLEMLYAAYPNTRIVSPYLTANAWEKALKKQDAKVINLCARYYIENGRFFPTPAEIIHLVPRIESLYSFYENYYRENDSGVDSEVDEYLANYMRLEGINGEIKGKENNHTDANDDLYNDENDQLS